MKFYTWYFSKFPFRQFVFLLVYTCGVGAIETIVGIRAAVPTWIIIVLAVANAPLYVVAWYLKRREEMK